MKTLLEVDRLCVGYGTRNVLQDVSFRAGAGEFVALCGNNGAGKSTLLDVIAGVRTADSGTVSLTGIAGAAGSGAAAARARSVSHLPQGMEREVPFNAGQVVAMGRYPHTDRWFENEDDRREIERAMRRTGCWEWRKRSLASLSGGERQRVLLAACLAQQAPVLLLDEPSTFLDVAAQLECFSLLREEAREGRLCLAVTHDLNLALTFCTRVLALAENRIARDFATERASREEGWLALFCGELRMGETPAGKPWVWYG